MKLAAQMKRFFCLILGLLLMAGVATAASPTNYPPDDKTVTITSTNMPIVWIEVGGRTIQHHDRITARMKIIHNGDGNLNYADTVAHPRQHIDYEGYVSLRYRGYSSYYSSDKKPYSFRPLTAPLEDGGEKKKVNILGMGKDNNWALLAPYHDRSMIRDLFAFEISRPWMEYTPEGRFCELYLDGIYYGVYILTEVVSKGKNRINLDDPGESGDELTGGYIMEVDRTDDVTYVSKYHPVTTNGAMYLNNYIHFKYKSPDFEDLSANQVNYINNRIGQMEDALASEDYRNPETGYRKYLDMMNFIDYQIAMELGHNVDGYRLSGKFFKRRDSEDPRFKMVLWDMNFAYGNANYYGGWRTDTWMYQNNGTLFDNEDPYMVPFWWYKLNKDPEYTAALKERWALYRRTVLREDRMIAIVDSLANVVTLHGAEGRNSQAWPRWGIYEWPIYHVSKNYKDEVSWLKMWLITRIAWMDKQLGYDSNGYLRGDVDGDGNVTITDVTVLIDYLLGSNTNSVNKNNADCDLNGTVTIADVTDLIEYLLRGEW